MCLFVSQVVRLKEITLTHQFRVIFSDKFSKQEAYATYKLTIMLYLDILSNYIPKQQKQQTFAIFPLFYYQENISGLIKFIARDAKHFNSISFLFYFFS